MDFPITFPNPAGSGEPIYWNQGAFRIEDSVTPVLKYAVNRSGWNNDLTLLHEETTSADHYIDVASRRHAVGRLKHWLAPNSLVLEVGCSSGYLLKDLMRQCPSFRIVGADYILGPLERLSRQLPTVPILQFDLTECPLPDQTFDGVVSLNVLEHIEDDNKAIRHIFRILKPGGYCVIEVPAGPHLFDYYDQHLQHFRRYTNRLLSSQFREAGFEVVQSSHLGSLMYPPFYLAKKWNRLRKFIPPDERQRLVQASISQAKYNPIMASVMRLEELVRYRVPLLAGIRCLLVARRLS